MFQQQYLSILCHFTLGVFLADRKFSLNVILKSPPLRNNNCCITLYYDLELPGFIENTTFLLMYATIFLILMSLGIALTRLKIFSLNKVIFSSIGRVIFGPIIGYLLILYFNLEGFAVVFY